jgi:hypothetical protein
MLVLTLLFLAAVGLRRSWDLRGYTGQALGMLTGRQRAYGYAHVERFLTQVAASGGAEVLANALGKWTAQLWHSVVEGCTEISPRFYVDGHRKPVYTDKLIPRGLIGRSGKILGCRALTLLHDEQGHPLLATTDRGDQHLTMGLPRILTRYEASGGRIARARIIVDREGMAAPFLRDLQASGYTVITLLRTDQYAGLDSFTNVREFVPLEYDQQGQVVREVASACFALPLPDQTGQVLPLRVALIRDWRRQVVRPLRKAGRRGRRGSGMAETCLVASRVEGRTHPCHSDHRQADSHYHHRRHRRCRGTRPDLHPTLASAREHPSGLAFTPGSGYQSRLCQDADCELRGGPRSERLWRNA